MKDVMELNSTKQILKSCRTAHQFDASNPENLSRALFVLMAWVHRGVNKPSLNAPEVRELEHHLRVLAGGMSSGGNTSNEMSQALRFVNYMVETFGDPAEALVKLDVFPATE